MAGVLAVDLGITYCRGTFWTEAVRLSDALTSHAGALPGQPGAVPAVGTGAVAIGVGHDGSSRCSLAVTRANGVSHTGARNYPCG